MRRRRRRRRRWSRRRALGEPEDCEKFSRLYIKPSSHMGQTQVKEMHAAESENVLSMLNSAYEEEMFPSGFHINSSNFDKVTETLQEELIQTMTPAEKSLLSVED